MDGGTETTPNSEARTLTRGRSIGIAIVQLLLAPVLFFLGFGFFFVGVGLSPEGTGDVLTLRDGVILALYAVVFFSVLLLLIGAPALFLARKSGRRRLARRAAYIPLGFAAASAIILTGLGIAGFVFDQVAGV